MNLSVALIMVVLGLIILLTWHLWSIRKYQVRELDLKLALNKAQVELSTYLKGEEEKKNFVELTTEQMKLNFKNLAQTIVEEKGGLLQKENLEKMNLMLEPLQRQIEIFQRQVHDAYEKENRERVALKTEVVQLKTLNEKMSDEANQLTQALKGQNKVQGGWGEMILARALEVSGLQEGIEYEAQVSLKDEQGKLYQPDFIIRLPHERVIIVDAKVSLVAYSRYVSSDEQSSALKDEPLKAHVNSIRTHVKQLASKAYHELLPKASLDFVLLFIPIESAFSLALKTDEQLYEWCLKQNIIVVTPTTLLATLRTIENLWRIEKQNRHALTIATKAGNLYDKFVGFSEDLLEIGKKIDGTQKSYEAALNKLSTGRGSIISKLEEIKSIGIKANKSIPKSLSEAACEKV